MAKSQRRNKRPNRRPQSVGLEPVGPRSDVAGDARDPHGEDSVVGPNELSVFLSYARADDDALGFVEPFKQLLTQFVHWKTGRKIATFHDQTDLLWGQRWQEELERSIMGASVFIPLLTARYLDRQNCRWEFNEFLSKARRLNAVDLVLPVIVVHAPTVFTADSEDDIAKTVVALQYESIEDAVLSDRGSQEWKRTMARIADRFNVCLTNAESQLMTSMNAEFDEALGPAVMDEVDHLARPGMLELLTEIEPAVGRLAESASRLGPAIEALGAAAQEAGLPKGQNPRQLLQWAIVAARNFEDPAAEIEAEGDEMLQTVQELDRVMASLGQVVLEVPQVGEALGDSLKELEKLSGVRDQLVELLSSLKPVEETAVPLRKALRPARVGLTKVTDALRTIESWALDN